MSSKKLKRFLSFALSLSMVFSMNVTSFAAEAAIPAATDAIVEDASATEDAGAALTEDEAGKDTADDAGQTQNPGDSADDAGQTQTPGDSTGDAGQTQNPGDSTGDTGQTPTDPVDPPAECAHDWVSSAIIRQPDCSTDTTGIELFTCSKCQDTKYEPLAPKHTAGVSTVTKAPTCVDKGEKSTTCTVCSKAYTEEIPATGKHDTEEKVTAATCQNPKKIEQVCRVCKAVTSSRTEGNPADHTYEVIRTTAATCTTAGSRELECSVCQATKTETIPALGGNHTEVDIPAVAATCNKKGMTAGKKCSVCGTITVAPQESTETQPDHTEVAIPDVDATCSAAGSTGGKKCSVCGTITEEPTEAPMDDTKHVWGDDFTVLKPPANCTDTGIGLYTCTLCGKSQYQTIADSHDWDEGTVTTAATCGTAGVKTFHCRKCDETKTENIPATNKHNFVEGRSEATCMQPAKVGKVCSVCKQADGEAKPVEGSKPLGHKWDDGKVTTQPGCDTPGVKTYTCTRKGCDGGTDGKPATKTETIAATHDWQEAITTPATCTAAGVKTLTCKNPSCPQKNGETAFSKTEDIPALGHDFAEKTLPATCYHATRTGMVCKRCKTPQDGDGNWVEYGQKVAHVYETTNTVNATCTTDGSITKTCKNCPETFEEQPVEGHTITETIPAGHKWNEWVVDTPATCTTEGARHRTCKVCHDDTTDPKTGYEEETIPATHTYDKGTIKQQQTCGNDEITLFTCTKCTADTPGHTKEEHTKVATGKHNYDAIVVPATCTTAMQVGELCKVCKQPKPGSEIATIGKPLGHDLETTYTAPTCTENGKSEIVCKREGCDHKATIDLGNIDAEQATNHAGTTKDVEAIPATCTTTGTAAGTLCTKCGKMTAGGEELAIDADAHKFVISTTLLEATCTEDGAAKYECDLCHKAVKFDVIGKGHIFDEAHCVTVPATCVKAGSKTYTCARGCEEEDNTKVEPILATDHKYDAGVITTPATCAKDGVKTFTCTNAGCTADTTGHTKTEAITKTGKHNFQDKAIPATCTAKAKVGSFCSVCDAENPAITPQEIGQPLGHDLEVTYSAPTCTKNGISKEACKRCEYENEKDLFQAGIAGEEAKGHSDTLEDVDAVPGTCMTKGTAAGKKCPVCDEIVEGGTETETDPDNHVFEVVTTLAAPTCTTDGAGKLKCKLCEKEQYGVIKASHTWDEAHPVIVPATCLTDGSKTFHCTVCEEGEKTETIAKTGHKYNNGIVTTPATCGKAGVKTFTCTNAGCTADTEGHSYTEPIAATNQHNYQEGYIDATCTEPMKAGRICTVCNKPDGELQSVGKPLGHDIESTVIEATCEEGAKAEETCKRCDYTATKDLSNLIPAKGHKPVEVAEVPATCTKAGTEAGTKCSVCDKSLSGMGKIEINPDNHEYELVNTLVEATCTTPGVGKYECPCDSVKFDEIAIDPVNGHNFVDGVCQNNCGKKAAAASTDATAGVIDGENKVTFENLITVTDPDATVVEMGILYITAEGYAGNPETDLTVSSASGDVRKKSTTETGTGYRFSLKVGTNVTRKLYARGFITVTDKAGKTQTYYGDIISGSYNDFAR